MAKPKEELPKYTCSSCLHCSEQYCRIFARPVDLEFNKCFKHSNYNMFAKPFTVQKNLDSIIEKEEAERENHNKTRLFEENQLRHALIKELKKKAS